MRRTPVLLVVVGLMLFGCDTGSDSPTSTSPRGELSCDNQVWVHGDPEESFEGYATAEEAVQEWQLGGYDEPPNGRWEHFEGNRWILIDDNGDTVGIAEVSEWTGNGVTTFATVRYASFNIEYCQS